MIYIGKCCSKTCCGACKCCGEGCSKTCEELFECHCCPNYSRLPFSTCSILFCIFLILPTLICVIYIMAKSEHTDWCEHNYVVAMIISIINFIITVAFVIYSVRKIGEGYFKAYEKYQNPNSIAKEVWKFICKDFVVLFFIVFYIWTFVWDCIILAWTNDENPVCEDRYGGVLSAADFVAGWHMAMTIVGFFFFVILLCLLACAENECVKPFIGFCLCGYDNIEKEKRRRRQMAVERDNQRNEEMKEQNRMNQPQYNPTAPGHNTNHPQGYTPQPSGPPVMPNHPYNPAGPANDPYANAYPAQPLPQSQPQAVKNSNTANNAGGAENQDKKGFFGKAKDKFNKFVGNNS